MNDKRQQRGSTLTEFAIASAILMVLFTAGYFVYTKPIYERVDLKTGLDQACQAQTAVAPDPAVLQVSSLGASCNLLPIAQIRASLMQLAARISQNVSYRIPVCAILLKADLGSACTHDLVNNKWVLNRSAITFSRVTGGESRSGGGLCPPGFADAVFAGDLGGSVTKLRALINVDCSQCNQNAWGVIAIPEVADFYGNACVTGTRETIAYPSKITPPPQAYGFVP